MSTAEIIARWVVVAALMPQAASADGADDRVRITDPRILEQLGFAPDATNVHATPGAYATLLMDPAHRAALEDTQRAERLAKEEADSSGGPYGTRSRGFTAVIAYGGIFPRGSSTAYTIPPGSGERVCLSGSPVFDVSLEGLPHGARLEFVDVWLRDDSAEHDFATELWRACQQLTPEPVDLTLLDTSGSDGAPGLDLLTMDMTAQQENVDLEQCAYFVRISFSDTGADCAAIAGELGVQKVRAEWVRQVSPAPPNPRFDDVPTDHLFFRHIEALAASGITGGCGGSSYCPDAPITRGQMAAYLAKALGLHW